MENKLEIFGICFVVAILITGVICAFNSNTNMLNKEHAKDVFCIRNDYDGYQRVKMTSGEYSVFGDFCKTDSSLKQIVTIDDEYRFLN